MTITTKVHPPLNRHNPANCSTTACWPGTTPDLFAGASVSLSPASDWSKEDKHFLTSQNLSSKSSSWCPEHPSSPYMTTQTPDFTTQTPHFTTQNPHFTTQTPDFTPQTPDFSTQTPVFTNKLLTLKAPTCSQRRPTGSQEVSYLKVALTKLILYCPILSSHLLVPLDRTLVLVGLFLFFFLSHLKVLCLQLFSPAKHTNFTARIKSLWCCYWLLKLYQTVSSFPLIWRSLLSFKWRSYFSHLLLLSPWNLQGSFICSQCSLSVETQHRVGLEAGYSGYNKQEVWNTSLAGSTAMGAMAIPAP